MQHDFYSRITGEIIAALEQGHRPWRRPWRDDPSDPAFSLPMRHTGEPYKGINTLALWARGSTAGYRCPFWMTFRQATEYEARVRKGEKGTLVIYADTIRRQPAEGADGTDEITGRRFWKHYFVFNAEQIEGLPDRFVARPPAPATAARIAQAEGFFAALHVDIRHGGSRAFYSVSTDHIQLPGFELFENAEAYYATLAHEAVHWTGHRSRLDRLAGIKPQAAGYGFEELVAELGAAFVCGSLQLAPDLRTEHVDYISHWIRLLQADVRAIVEAASAAQRAADFLRDLQAPPAPSSGGSIGCAIFDATAPILPDRPHERHQQSGARV